MLVDTEKFKSFLMPRRPLRSLLPALSAATYGRPVSTCPVGKMDLAYAMAEHGWAWAFKVVNKTTLVSGTGKYAGIYR